MGHEADHWLWAECLPAYRRRRRTSFLPHHADAAGAPGGDGRVGAQRGHEGVGRTSGLQHLRRKRRRRQSYRTETGHNYITARPHHARKERRRHQHTQRPRTGSS